MPSQFRFCIFKPSGTLELRQRLANGDLVNGWRNLVHDFTSQASFGLFALHLALWLWTRLRVLARPLAMRICTEGVARHGITPDNMGYSKTLSSFEESRAALKLD